jgi:DNA-binding MarR family transcriptional regulator
MSTKKNSGRKNRNARTRPVNGLPPEISEPQGLKPASLSAGGTAESRALPKPVRDFPKTTRPLPEPIRDSPKPIREPPQPMDETSSDLPGDRSRKPRAESPKPEAVAVADRLHSAAIHLLRRVRKQDVATGEGPARLSALSVLVFGGPKTLGELAAAEQVKPPTMSRIVAGLAKSRLIDIAVDPADARRMQIRVTTKGKSILQKGRDRRIAHLASQLKRLTREELNALGDAVEILHRTLREWD